MTQAQEKATQPMATVPCRLFDPPMNETYSEFSAIDQCCVSNHCRAQEISLVAVDEMLVCSYAL